MSPPNHLALAVVKLGYQDKLSKLYRLNIRSHEDLLSFEGNLSALPLISDGQISIDIATKLFETVSKMVHSSPIVHVKEEYDSDCIILNDPPPPSSLSRINSNNVNIEEKEKEESKQSIQANNKSEESVSIPNDNDHFDYSQCSIQAPIPSIQRLHSDALPLDSRPRRSRRFIHDSSESESDDEDGNIKNRLRGYSQKHKFFNELTCSGEDDDDDNCGYDSDDGSDNDSMESIFSLKASDSNHKCNECHRTFPNSQSLNGHMNGPCGNSNKSIKPKESDCEFVESSNESSSIENDEQHIDDFTASEEDEIVPKEISTPVTKQRHKGKGRRLNKDGRQRAKRLLLRDAMKDTASQSEWSQARTRAYGERESNPNAYYYRFLDPCEEPSNGKWTDEEHRLFMQRVLELGVSDNWGIFSKAIPGRVGYQCSNRWAVLIKNGQVKDMNFYYDSKKKKWDFKWKNGGKNVVEAVKNCKKYSFEVLEDASNVWTDLPKEHPKCLSQREVANIEQRYSKYLRINYVNWKNVKCKKRKNTNNLAPCSKRRKTSQETGF